MVDWIRCPQGANSLTLLDSSVFVSVSGWLADSEYSLTYENRTPDLLKDVRFEFPVDDSSAVYRLEADLNGRTIECECREKSEAESAYRTAVDQGLSAAFASESDDTSDLMNFFLGNVASGGQVKIRMRSLVSLEAPERWVASLTIPRVLVPRYRPETDGDKPLKQAASASAASTGVSAPWLAGLRLRGRVSSDSAPLRLVRSSQGELQWRPGQQEFSLSELSPDCDIELTVEFEPPSTGAMLLREAGADGSDSKLFSLEAAALTCFFDDSLLQSSTESPKEFVIVVDRSGSMGGRNIVAAKEALLLFLKSLPRNCLFNIVSFGSGFEKLFSESKQYSEAKLKEALDLQATMAADMGGTEILSPLQWVFEKRSKDRQTRVILLTDGEVSNVEQVKDLVLKSCGDGRGSRVFAIGIGQGVSTSLVKGVARVGRGRAEFVRNGDSAQLRRSVIGLLKAAQLPSVEDLQVTACTSEGDSVLVGTVPSDLSCGSLTPLSAFLLLRPEASGQAITVTVGVSIDGRAVSVVCVAAANEASGDAAAAPIGASVSGAEAGSSGKDGAAADSRLVHRAAARLQLKEWTDQNSTGDRTRDIVALSIAANLVSPHTAFVGIDRETREPQTALLRPREEEDDLKYCLANCGLADGGSFPSHRRSIQPSKKLQSSAMGSKLASAAPKARSKSFFNFRLPTINLFGRKAKRTDSMKRSATACETAGPSGSSAFDRNLHAVGDADAVLRIAASQKFDGRWELSDELLALLSLTKAEMEAAAPDGEAPDVWFTALVCAHLETRLQSKRSEWELLADKAKEFLKSSSSCGLDQLMTKAKALAGKSAAGGAASS